MKLAVFHRSCGLVLLAGMLVTTLRSEPDASQEWIRGIYAGKSPRVIALPALAAWQSARDFAGNASQTFVVVGTGKSMEPLYPPGTLLVLRPIAYGELQSGQTVVYRNQSQQAVAHVLVARTTDGWRIAGLNNRTHDMEPVLADNLLGVVIAAYRPLPEPGGTHVAAR